MHRTTSMASVPAAAKQGRRHVVEGPPRAPPASLLAGGGPATGAAADHGGVETAAFLKNCALCGRDLGPGKDTYIYRYADHRFFCCFFLFVLFVLALGCPVKLSFVPWIDSLLVYLLPSVFLD